MSRRMVSSILLAFLLTSINVSVFVSSGWAWSNGGYSADPSNPDYGTHDWIAQHALDRLPVYEKQYILDNLATYLYGTELPDNGGAPDGIGDTTKHHIYYWSNGSLQDDASAIRASQEYYNTLNFLKAKDYAKAAKNAGIMSHYVVDVAVFGHVMGSGTDWGTEVHHTEDYEPYVNERTSSYSAEFDSYLFFDGSLANISAYDAAKNLAYDTTFDVDGDLTCVWMDENYNWDDPTFKNRAGESLNLAVNYLTDVLHTLFLDVAWKVDDDGPADFGTIQEAINAANPGDTIYVHNGTYYENVVVNKSLTLVGEDASNTVIDGGNIGRVVTVTANNTVISRFTIQMAGFTPWESNSGVYLNSSKNIVTDNNIVNNEDWGIWLDSYSNNNTVTYNNITNNWRACMLKNTSGNTINGNNVVSNDQDGVHLWGSSNNIISDNNISNNGHGIILDSSLDNNVTGNNISNNFYGVSLFSSSGNTLRYNALDNNFYGLEVSGFLYLDNQLSYFIQDIDDSNTVNGKPIYYWVNHHGEQVASDAGFVALVNCTNITVKDLNLKNNAQGMVLACTDYSRIQNLTVTDNEHGIYLYSSFSNTISGSNISNNQVGISLESSSENNIAWNNVTDAREGIFLSYSSKNNITNNIIAKIKYHGVSIGLSSENNIAYNNITDNEITGIGVSSNGIGIVENNLIHHNNLINNTYGVELGDTSGNKCYKNNFINNTKQASVHVSFGSVSYGNVWDDDYPFGGNYWSDYNGTDLYSGSYQNITSSDGIGDTPYVIDENNRDRYPLMTPWTPPTDTTPPLTQISLSGVSGENYWFTSNVIVTLSSDDASGISKIEYSFDNDTWITYTTPFTVTNEGSTIIYYKSTDKATPPNVEAIESKTIKIDKTTPTILITAPSPGYEVKSSTVTVTWTGSDATSGISHYEIRLDGGSWTNKGTNTTHTFTGLGDGSYTIDVKVTDKAGNTKQDTVNFTVNTSPLFGPGYMEETAIASIIIILAFGIALYFLKIRKH